MHMNILRIHIFVLLCHGYTTIVEEKKNSKLRPVINLERDWLRQPIPARDILHK